ncbi:MAG: hypothetical protein KGS48_02570 [Bacteroidetes bacterium]|nr:hypothetical protein [Bacteroidota bacterium]
MNHTLRLLFLLSGMLFLFQCSKRETETIQLDASGQYAYFPLHIGQSADYLVDSIVYDFKGNLTLRDSSRSWVRRSVVDTTHDHSGALVYILERYEKKSPGDSWQFKNRYYAAANAEQAAVTEDNLRFLNLSFPLYQQKTWNVNVWIDPSLETSVAGERMRLYNTEQSQVESIDKPLQIGAFAFDSVLTVQEADFTSAFQRRYSLTRYAKHVGIAYREQWMLDSQYCNQTPTPADCLTKPWQDKAERGYILKQTLLSYQ